LNTINKVLFIGLGGAGQRHLRVIRHALPSVNIIAYRQTSKTPLLNIDFSVNNDSTLEDKYNIIVYDDLDQAYEQKPDLVVIATPTSLHYEHIIRASNEGAAVIVEKPGCMTHNEALKARDTLMMNQTKFLISFQRRFHPIICNFKRILDRINRDELKQIDIKVNSYVPSWHPYEDYKKLYACKASLGGGVLLTESHEIDLIVWLFGTPNSIKSKISSRKTLKLDVEDSVDIFFQYDSFQVNIELDFMSDNQQRDIYFKTQNDNFYLDMDSGRYKHTTSNQVIIEELLFSNKNMFSDQFNYFINCDNSDLGYIDSLCANLALIDQCKKLSN